MFGKRDQLHCLGGADRDRVEEENNRFIRLPTKNVCKEESGEGSRGQKSEGGHL